MLFIQNSQDVLNISKAISVLVLAGFTCWFIYYLARIMQSVFRVIKEMQERMHRIDEILKLIKEKLESSATYLVLIVEGVRKLVEMMSEKKDKGKNEKKQ